MQEEDDLRGLARVMDFMRGVSVLLMAANLYWFCRGALAAHGLVQPLAAQDWGQGLAAQGWVQGLTANSGTPALAAHGWAPNLANKILLNFHRTAGLFNGTLPSKLFALLLLALSCLGSRGVKSEKITWRHIAICGAIGLTLFLIAPGNAAAYTATTIAGYILLLKAGTWMSRLLKNRLAHDPFNVENESFMQEMRLKQNEYSVNLPTKFYYHKRWRQGWINVVNPFRATMVLGTPGSGKSYAVVNNYIKQQIEKGFALYIYDFKFPDLTEIAYNHLLLYAENYKVTPKFYVINFDDPRRSHRCNPIHPRFMTDISDAYESAYTIMLNLNRTWIQKQGDFFVDSPIILLAAIIWFLKIYDDGRYCTFPHAIELLNNRYADIFTILTSYDQLENYLSPFIDAWQGGAQDQLQGQLASAKIPLSRMISPQLYWVMTGDDFTLDINNPAEPKILCVGNNPDRQSIYSAALGLYNSRIVKLINKKDQLKSGVIIDELPTIYFRGLDNLIATARSNKVAVCLGFT